MQSHEPRGTRCGAYRAAANSSRRPFARSHTACESLEARRLLSGPEPLTLFDEHLAPGDLDVGPAPQAQLEPFISAGPDGVTLALWSDYRTGGMPNRPWGMGNGTMSDIWGARIAPDGTLIDEVPLIINNDGWNQTGAKAAWNGSNWLVVWSSEQNPYTTHLHAARLSPAGEILDAQPILIMDDSFQDQFGNPVDPEGPLDVQPNGDGWVVTWWRGEPNPSGPFGSDKAFYATRVDAAGNVLDTAGVPLFAGPYNTTFWVGFEYSPSGGGQYLQAHMVDSTVHFIRRDMNLNVLSSTSRTGLRVSPYRNDMVGSAAGWMLASRWDGAASYVEINSLSINAAGTPAASQQIAYSAYSEDPRVAVAFDGQGYVVSYDPRGPWDPNLGFTWSVYSRRIALDGTMADPFLVSNLGNPSYDLAAVGHSGGAYSILFADSAGGVTDIAIFNVAGDDSLTSVHDVSNAARAHSSPVIASDGTDFLAVFHSFNQDSSIIKGIRLDNTGLPIDSEPFTIVPDSLNPAGYQIVHFGDRYVVTFTGDGPAGRMIYAQQVDSDAQLIGAPIPMTAGLSMDNAAVLGDRLILIGNSREGTAHLQYRFARIFADDLSAVTDRFMIGLNFALNGDVTTVGGRWLATWQWKSTHDAPRHGVAYNYISIDGTHTGHNTLVSTFPDNGRPTIASAGENADEAMIVFPRFNGTFPQDQLFLHGQGLVGQRMAADGAKIGGLIVLIDEPGAQIDPRASFDGSQYVVAWVDGRNNPYPAQEHADVFGARVAIDGTVLDPGGFAIADSSRPEDSAVAASGGGHTFFIYRQFRYEKPYAAYRIATRMLADITGPDPEAASFNYHHRQDLGLVFNERLFNLDTANLQIVNRDTGQVVDPALFNLVERVGAAHQWEYDWVLTGSAFLPDGNYRATLPAGSVTDKAGNPLANDLVIDFWFLLGDVNRDREVGLADLLTVRANFGKSGVGYTGGDVNYDGIVDLADLLLVRGRFGQVLPPPRSGGDGGEGGDGDDGDGNHRSLFSDGGDGGSGITAGWFDDEDERFPSPASSDERPLPR